jgi:hypothetical protein
VTNFPFFFRISDFLDERSVRRWAALSASDPDQAARNALGALSAASLEDRRGIAGDARRRMVWTLVGLAWPRSAFPEAAKSLALLAEAENETWSNNASSEFVARFRINLAGTPLPYLDRLATIDEILAMERPTLTNLSIRALAQVGTRGAYRMVGEPATDALPEKEWRPETVGEAQSCIEAAVSRLIALARQGAAATKDSLVHAARQLAMLLLQTPVRDIVTGFLNAVREAYPDSREILRQAIADVINRERKYWKRVSAEELRQLDATYDQFRDPTLAGQLREIVGQPVLDQTDQPDLHRLAEDLLTAPLVLYESWPWLTSGDAHDAWRLGAALAEVDREATLANQLAAIPGAGQDFRLVAGYIKVLREVWGDEWYDKWLATQADRNPRPTNLIFDVAWRCGPTENEARLLATMLRDEHVAPHLVGQLVYSRWGQTLDSDVLEVVLRAMIANDHLETAIGILQERMNPASSDRKKWDPMALDLVTRSELIRSNHPMTSFWWKDVAQLVLVNHPREVAAAILDCQADHTSGYWFAEHSEAAPVLSQCLERDPAGVWELMKGHLTTPVVARMFSVGFPRGIVDRVPADQILDWIAEKPEERAVMLAPLARKDFSDDSVLASKILGKYGDNEGVGDAFFAEYDSGMWEGPASVHFNQLGDALANLAKRTGLPKLRRWAAHYAKHLLERADDERRREEEEGLRGR